MKTTISTWSRVSLLSMVGAIEGNVLTVYRAGKWIAALEFTQAERDEIGLAEVGNSLSWRNAHDWEVELPDDPKALELVRDTFKAHKWLAGNYKELEGLAKILGVPMEE